MNWAVHAIIGLLVGWVAAHYEVANECERQGNFYVAAKTYDCELREGADQ